VWRKLLRLIVAVWIAAVWLWRHGPGRFNDRRPRRNHWIAVSPSAQIDLGNLTDMEALRAGQGLGRVSYIDRQACVVFFDTHLGLQQTEK
jgi:hypothetical protein